ncbi:hypothetical protein I8H89_05015 [Candidatus Saccharibacteria bacterium]|nr:hypothetical protein [Candidatus Saccharibacteria bacterium]
MAITKLMREVTTLYENGTTIDEIANKYNISVGSVFKKIRKTQRANRIPASTPKPQPSEHGPKFTISTRRARTWDLAKIKSGIDEFVAIHGVMPTSADFTNANKLPSARNVQRMFGGLEQLRKQLGYKEQNFTKGGLRQVIAHESNLRGLGAEDAFEPLLIEKFGEPYVHVQKRYYKGSKNRYDFFVYAKNRVFGIDIFTTSRLEYISNNVRHKVLRYKNAPAELSIFFVLIGEEYKSEDLRKITATIKELGEYPNMSVFTEIDFLTLIESFESLRLPEYMIGLDTIEY